MYFIRFNFPKNVNVVKKAKRKLSSNKASGQIKRKKIMIVAGHGYNDPGAVGNGTNERDFIRKNLTPKIADYLRKTGHEVALYGGSKQSQDMYQDTAYGVRVGNKRDYGMYWVNKFLNAFGKYSNPSSIDTFVLIFPSCIHVASSLLACSKSSENSATKKPRISA